MSKNYEFMKWAIGKVDLFKTHFYIIDNFSNALSEPVLGSCSYNHSEQISLKFEAIFMQGNAFENDNSDNFVSASMR